MTILTGQMKVTTDHGWDVGIDLDGCVYDFVQAVRKEIERRMPDIDTRPEARSWAFYERWGLATEDFLDLYAQGVRERRILWEGDPLDGTIQAWHALANSGHRIHVVTDRNPPGAEDAAHEATLSWLAEHNLPYDSITFSPDKTLILSHARDSSRVTFVDDKHENHQSLLSAGVSSFLMDRPWNKKLSGPRVASILEYSTRVAQLSGRPLVAT